MKRNKLVPTASQIGLAAFKTKLDFREGKVRKHQQYWSTYNLKIQSQVFESIFNEKGRKGCLGFLDRLQNKTNCRLSTRLIVNAIDVTKLFNSDKFLLKYRLNKDKSKMNKPSAVVPFGCRFSTFTTVVSHDLKSPV